MQSINVTVVIRWFMSVFMGTAVACLGLAVTSLAQPRESAPLLRLLSCLVYLIGSLGVTARFNVPRNDALAATTPKSLAGAELWARFVPAWTDWNTIRIVASIAAAVLLGAALLVERNDSAVSTLAGLSRLDPDATLSSSILSLGYEGKRAGSGMQSSDSGAVEAGNST